MYMLLAKSQEFDFNTMNARVEIAVLDHSNNVHRKQDVIKKERRSSGRKNDLKWYFSSSKLSKDWVARQVMEPKSYSFVNDIIANIIGKKIVGVSIQVEASRQAPYLPKSAPKSKNIASTPRPNVSDITAKFEITSRFKEG